MQVTQVWIRRRNIALLLPFETIPTVCANNYSRNPDKIATHTKISTRVHCTEITARHGARCGKKPVKIRQNRRETNSDSVLRVAKPI